MDSNLVRQAVDKALDLPPDRLYQAVFENAKDCFVLCDPASGQILALNRSARNLLGYTPQEVLALTLDCIHPPRSHKQCKVAFARLMVTGEVFFETQYKRKDGSTFPVEISASRFELDGRQLVQGIARDITARKQAEKTLQQAIKKERLIHSLELRMGLAREKLINAIALRIRESLDLQTCLQTTVDEIRQFLQADRVLIYAFKSDGSGDVPVESVGPTWTTSPDQTFVDPCSSSSYAEAFSQGEPSVVPDVYQASYSSEQLVCLQRLKVRAELIVPVFQGDCLWGLMMVHQCHSPRDWKASEVDLLQQLAIQVAIAVHQADLHHQTRTELAQRKRMTQALEQARDEALAAAKVKSEFLAVMSHEIRTPMNGVIGMTNLLLDTPLDTRQHHYVETIRSCGSVLLALINNILDMSKIESNKLELESETFSLKQCVDGAIALLKTRADEKQLYLNCYVAPEIPSSVVGDATRLRQILVNLISNAIKFTSVGSVMVSVLSIRPQPSSDSSSQPSSSQPSSNYELTFSVRDTGIGIPQERIDRLFKPFSQVDSSISRQYGGTGLGLAISQRLCEAMGGEIWVESQVEKGSCFYFKVCVRVSDRKSPLSITSTIDSPSSTSSTKLAERLPLEILVAEDNLVNQQLVRQWLKQLGYQATLVNNGQEALDALRQHSYDLVLMDVQMPKMDGISATQQICQQWPDAERPKIIAMTANAMKGDREICLNAGMDAYLSKPVQLQDLITTIEQCCSPQDPLAAADASSESPTLLAPQALFDLQQLEATAQPLGGLTQSWLSPFIDLYETQGTELIEQLLEASWHQDDDVIAYAAHTLKSSSAALGLIALSEGCQKIEDHTQQQPSNNISDIAQLISQVETIFRPSVQVLRALVKTIPAD